MFLLIFFDLLSHAAFAQTPPAAAPAQPEPSVSRSGAQSIYIEELLSSARSAALAREPAWLALLHYKRGRSDAEGDFFLSPRGAADPEAELEADLRAFFEPGVPAEGAAAPAAEAPRWTRAQHPQCRYPARYFWLKRRLSIDPARLADQPCARFRQWERALDAESATLVFADAFVNNPASMYGHTFLRLRRKDGKPPLLDYTVNFAGNPDTDNGVLYAFRGIFGLFPGTYSTEPYYLKLQEYSNIEARDLWEYDLNLSTPAVAQLIRHAWEMGGTSFPYYFFSENCSYQLLTLLDAADPSLHLADGFGFGTIPGNTVRAALARPGLVSTRRYRPSHIQEMLARRAVLDAPEESLAGRVSRFDPSAQPLLAALTPASEAAVLDSAYDYLRYRKGFSDTLGAGDAAAERRLLIARGKLGVPPSAVEPAPPPPLEAGHDTARVALGGGVDSHGIFQELAFRAALHDLAADPRGYQEGSQLEMGDVRLRFDDRDKVPYLERLALVDIQSLSPWDRWVRKPSWRVSTGVEQAKELGKAPVDSMIYDLSAGIGLAGERRSWPLSPLLFGFAEADAGAGPALPQSWRLGAGGSAGLLLRPFPWWRLLGQAGYRDFWQRSPHQERLTLTSSWTLSRDLEARVVLDRRVPDSEAGGYLLVYF